MPLTGRIVDFYDRYIGICIQQEKKVSTCYGYFTLNIGSALFVVGARA